MDNAIVELVLTNIPNFIGFALLGLWLNALLQEQINQQKRTTEALFELINRLIQEGQLSQPDKD